MVSRTGLSLEREDVHGGRKGRPPGCAAVVLCAGLSLGYVGMRLSGFQRSNARTAMDLGDGWSVGLCGGLFGQKESSGRRLGVV